MNQEQTPGDSMSQIKMASSLSSPYSLQSWTTTITLPVPPQAWAHDHAPKRKPTGTQGMNVKKEIKKKTIQDTCEVCDDSKKTSNVCWFSTKKEYARYGHS